MSSPGKRYKGLLNEKIAVYSDTTDEEIGGAESHRIAALYEHFGIPADDPGAQDQLVLALARKHVPGFQRQGIDQFAEAAVGRPNALGLTDRVMLQIDVRLKRRRVDPKTGRKFTVSDAISAIASEPQYEKIKPATLRRIYFSDCKKSALIPSLLDEYGAKFEMAKMRRSKPQTREFGAFVGCRVPPKNLPKKRVRKPK